MEPLISAERLVTSIVDVQELAEFSRAGHPAADHEKEGNVGTYHTHELRASSAAHGTFMVTDSKSDGCSSRHGRIRTARDHALPRVGAPGPGHRRLHTGPPTGPCREKTLVQPIRFTSLSLELHCRSPRIPSFLVIRCTSPLVRGRVSGARHDAVPRFERSAAHDRGHPVVVFAATSGFRSSHAAVLCPATSRV